ncbi:MAG: FecR family protein [Acidobacteriota bacterium]
MLNTKRLSGISPKVAIVGALIAIVAVSGIALLLTRGGSEANGDPAMQPRAARLERVDGSVGIARAEDQDKQLDWAEATINTPITVGDRIYARDNAHASIALTGHHYVRLNPATSLDVLSLEDQRTQLALRSGSALFDVGDFAPDEFYEVATPYGAVDFKEPGLYQVGIDGDNAIISVLSGLAQVVGQGGSGYISKGEVLTLLGAAAAQALSSRIAPREAGYIVDDYYRHRYPRTYDGRYQDYDAYLDDPFYYDPYRTSLSSQYLPSADIPGLYDLDSYGDWVDVNDYGHSWAPRVSAGWAPFRSGSWDLDELWGPSWVSSEPWGWAPYHYGRWAYVNQRWLWVPEVRTRPAYSPATVAFIPLGEEIGWVPLGPGEDYVPRYYDNFRPRYLASEEVVRVVTVQNTFVNLNAPGGVTVVPVRGLTRVIDPRVITPVDAGLVGRSRAVLDPFSVAGVRELAIRGDGARRRIKFERREQEAFNTPVVASSMPEVLAVRGNIAKRLRVEAVPERRKENKLRINEGAEVTSSRRPDGLPQPLAQSQRMAELASRAEQGDKSARRQMRQLMREEQRAAPLQPQVGTQQQQAQHEQTRQQIKEQRRAERQQQAPAAAGQEAALQAQQQQMKQQRRAERQQQAAAASQQDAARQAQQQQQMKQQRRAERQQQAAAASQQDAARQAQQQQQMKQQRRAERQQQAAAASQQDGARQAQQQQVKQQRRTERQQQAAAASQQDAARQGQQQQQMKQQRKAERQQQSAAQQEQVRQQEQTRQQRKEQKRRPPEASVQQQQLQQAQQEAAQSQMAQQHQQMKQQRRAERQQQAAAGAQQDAARQAQQQQQMKQQRRAERHQQVAAQQQQTPAPAGAREDKAQRKAEKAQRRAP